MHKFLSIFLLGIITLSMQSCSQETPQSTSTKNSSTPPPNSAKSAANSLPSNPAVAAASTLAVASQKAQSDRETAGLIPSTNPDRRVQASIKGRKDPFAFVSMMAKIKIPEKKASDVAIKLDNKPKNLPTIPAQTTPVIQPVSTEPTLANSVAVTGVIDIGGILKAIVKAPEEEASRYVEVGQYLSNGQILVKNIDTSDPLNPSVVLEQSGVQVSKKVGEAVQNSDATGNTQALAYPSEQQ